jgi:hypothetical protein
MIERGNEMDEYEVRLLAYRALAHAAEQTGRSNYRKGIYKPVYRKGKLVRGYTVTPEHAALVAAMPKVLSGAMSVDEAMAMVTSPAVMDQRF